MKVHAFVLLFLAFTFAVNAQTCNPLALLYRTNDGSCNNILFSSWGKTGSPYINGPEGTERYTWAEIPRIVPMPEYGDVDTLPSEGPRGNARNISNHVSNRIGDEIDPINHSMLAIQYGQFLCHDIDANAFNMADSNNASDPEQFPLVSYLRETDHEPMCATGCTANDTILGSIARTSAGVREPSGVLKVKNNASPYFDMDHIYGRTDAANDKLRTKTGGKLLLRESVSFTFEGKSYEVEDILPSYAQTGLPVNPSFLQEFLTPREQVFTAGDERVNENLALNFFHTLWAREHNRICDELMEENFLWKLAPSIFDEIIFQKARSITNAKYQHVIYSQYIPSTFGSPISDSVGTYSGYNPLLESATYLAFSSGAFRYGHFSLRNFMSLDECGVSVYKQEPTPNPDEKIIFGSMTAPTPPQFQPVILLGTLGGFENLARGLINERAAPVNGKCDDIIRNLPVPGGVVDLIALDLMRARYNQLPNYQTVREAYYGSTDPLVNKIYGLPGCPAFLETDPDTDDPIECFTYISSDLERVEKVMSVYRKINLIDPLIGMGVEDHIPGATVGKTLGNILIRQFKRTRDSDRFFYRNILSSFSTSERNTILSTTLGEVMRRNLKSSVGIPDNPFVVPENYRQSLIDAC